MDNRTHKPNVLVLIAWIVLVVIPVLTYVLVSAGITKLAILKIENPREYKSWFINFLGVQVRLVNSQDEVPYIPYVEENDVGTFPIEYWNGQTVTFYVTDEVLEASASTDCDPWLLVAVAFSESPYYNNTSCSVAGACGVWQFMPDTWNSLWPEGEVPSRFHIPSAADAACRYMTSNGMANSINKSRLAFIFDFAIQPPVWNMHLGQAGFVWDLVAEIRERGGIDPIDPPHTDPNPPFTLTKIWWKIPLVWVFNQLGMLPSFLAFNPDPVYPLEPQEGDEWVAWPYPPGSFTINGPLHGQDYGECALDLTRGAGTEVLSPVNGVITQKYVDGLDNPIIQIENSIYLVRLYHGDWTVDTGDIVTITQKVGYENTYGNSSGSHTHFHIIKKGYGCTSPDLLINYPPPEEIEP